MYTKKHYTNKNKNENSKPYLQSFLKKVYPLKAQFSRKISKLQGGIFVTSRIAVRSVTAGRKKFLIEAAS